MNICIFVISMINSISRNKAIGLNLASANIEFKWVFKPSNLVFPPCLHIKKQFHEFDLISKNYAALERAKYDKCESSLILENDIQWHQNAINIITSSKHDVIFLDERSGGEMPTSTNAIWYRNTTYNELLKMIPNNICTPKLNPWDYIIFNVTDKMNTIHKPTFSHPHWFYVSSTINSPTILMRLCHIWYIWLPLILYAIVKQRHKLIPFLLK